MAAGSYAVCLRRSCHRPGRCRPRGLLADTRWGWTTLALAWLAVVALVLGDSRPGGFELAWIAGLAAVTGWTAVTWLWTASQTQTALEVERTLTYLAVALAAAAVVRRSGVEALVGVSGSERHSSRSTPS